MTVLKNAKNIQDEINNRIKSKIEKDLHLEDEGLQLLTDPDTPLNICGSLVAPSFDLIGRTRESVSKDVKDHKKDYEDLEKILRDKGKIDEGFTLIDVIDATGKLFPHISLIKLVRFKRSDEIIPNYA